MLLKCGELKLFVKRSVILAGSVILRLLIHSESSPSRRSEYVLVGNVMHTYGDAKYRTESNKVSAYVAVADCSVVCAPAVHNAVSILKGRAFLAVAARCEPGARPSIVGSLPEDIGNFTGKINRSEEHTSELQSLY